MKMQRGFIPSESMTAMMLALIVIGAILGMLVMWGIPTLWGFIKPWLHTVTG